MTTADPKHVSLVRDPFMTPSKLKRAMKLTPEQLAAAALAHGDDRSPMRVSKVMEGFIAAGDKAGATRLLDHPHTQALVYGYALEALLQRWPDFAGRVVALLPSLRDRDNSYERVHALRGLHRLDASHHDALVAALEVHLFGDDPGAWGDLERLVGLMMRLDGALGMRWLAAWVAGPHRYNVAEFLSDAADALTAPPDAQALQPFVQALAQERDPRVAKALMGFLTRFGVDCSQLERAPPARHRDVEETAELPVDGASLALYDPQLMGKKDPWKRWQGRGAAWHMDDGWVTVRITGKAVRPPAGAQVERFRIEVGGDSLCLTSGSEDVQFKVPKGPHLVEVWAPTKGPDYIARVRKAKPKDEAPERKEPPWLPGR